MTTVTADPTARIRPGGSPVHLAGAQLRILLAGLLLALMALLILDNHVMALPGGSFAEIGVARAALEGELRSAVVAQHAAPDRLTARSTGRSAHELRHCFVHARRSGQDPAGCRPRP